MINGRYHLHEKLGQGGMGIVHRATDRLTGEIVALKQVFLPIEQIMFASRPISQANRELRLALAHEFQTLAGLRHPHIISVLDYGFDDKGQPFFTMSYLERAETLLAAGNGRSLPQKVTLLLQMLEALAYLHRRGILHRDLKPDNVLVVGDTVRVLDFGLAAAKEQATDSVGSWLYMAPEVLLGRPASEASDLYAVGVLAYRLLAGTHPFNIYAEDVVGEILDGEPDWSKVDASVQAVVRTLLAKKPENRYQTAVAASTALAHAIGLSELKETAVIRESYLQAAKFVGRETEMTHLQAALSQARAGHGSAWLLGGESGVGKSRLLRELQTEALVSGFQVLWGQGIRDAGGAPYQLWGQPVRQMLLAASAVDDSLASVLKQLAPDAIETLLGRPIPSAPTLSEDAVRQRLYAALKQLISLQTKPVLLLLEDLQWAEESLLPLPLLMQGIEKRPLLLISTYRNDEKPHLPQMLPAMNTLSLARLNQTQMQSLAVAILGKTGEQGQLVEFLVRQTEGNAFFAVEMLRQLAEEAGRLQNIGQTILPERLLPEGVHAIVQRRIHNVPPRAQPLLQLAAVAGRAIDPSLLSLLADEGVDVERWWLPLCAETAVLEVVNNQWRFAHDKIREAILTSLPASAFIAHHHQVATGLVTLYGNQPAYASTIAFHWHHAQQPEQEQPYLIAAGDYAMAQYLNQEALEYYERAYGLMRPAETAVALRQNIDLINKLAAGMNEHDAQRAYTLAEEAYTLTQHPLLADAPYWRGVAESQNNKGDALCEIGQVAQGLALLLEAYAHFEAQGDLYQAGLVVGNIGFGYWLLGDYLTAEKYALQLGQLAEKANDQRLLIRSYISLAMAYDKLKRPEEEVAYEQKALQMARQIGDRYLEATILNNHSVTLVNHGKTAEGVALALKSLELAQEIGYTIKLLQSLSNLVSFYMQLEQFANATFYLQEYHRLITNVGTKTDKVFYAIMVSDLHLAQGNGEESLASLRQAEEDSQEIDAQPVRFAVYNALEKVYTAMGKDEEAELYRKRKEELR